ncbi:unnamed protein product [Vitrella brassicaformis CCMP3155]|uniref:Uncharacterized protein n=1 Tax=Vitrella brassicaformis (strain CCMP3155) TaxID=1169540 RepID=A0A0G4ENV0_VITBC|nr:unnamed protein product [Vitrella brassicaformis CCMP3155]|eukprot:CEL99116.1 unnamed protein product [Vitrella brassicaformis CCMP3155]
MRRLRIECDPDKSSGGLLKCVNSAISALPAPPTWASAVQPIKICPGLAGGEGDEVAVVESIVREDWYWSDYVLFTQLRPDIDAAITKGHTSVKALLPLLSRYLPPVDDSMKEQSKALITSPIILSVPPILHGPQHHQNHHQQ